MLKIAKLTFNPIQENTYILWDESGECIVVDAGNISAREDNRLVDFITEQGLNPVMAVNTHGHFDHLAGVEHLRRTYDIPFAMSSKDAYLLEAAPTSARMFGIGEITAPTKIDIDLDSMEELRFGNTTLKIIHTPGHTPGHVSLYNEEMGVVLTGDTLFRESIGRTDLPGGDYSWIMRSILDKLIVLGDEVKVYPGHGEETTIGHESLYNPFIVEVINKEVNF
ncbi:MAG: MBL fold metallo-hydrolase [Alistipes sp.]|nr:MBL fold metallo-hydrolase [Alistipes sp.]